MAASATSVMKLPATMELEMDRSLTLMDCVVANFATVCTVFLIIAEGVVSKWMEFHATKVSPKQGRSVVKLLEKVALFCAFKLNFEFVFRGVYGEELHSSLYAPFFQQVVFFPLIIIVKLPKMKQFFCNFAA